LPARGWIDQLLKAEYFVVPDNLFFTYNTIYTPGIEISRNYVDIFSSKQLGKLPFIGAQDLSLCEFLLIDSAIVQLSFSFYQDNPLRFDASS
jgi:hypothetical protein